MSWREEGNRDWAFHIKKLYVGVRAALFLGVDGELIGLLDGLDGDLGEGGVKDAEG